MIKKIKFSLLLGDKPCRSLEDIRENFNISDVLDRYKDGTLNKWLSVYNYKEEYDKLLLIDENIGDKEKLFKLSEIFLGDEKDFEELKKDIEDFYEYYKKIEDFKKEHSELDKLSIEYIKKDEELKKREEYLSNLEKELKDKENRLNDRENDIKRREEYIKIKENEIRDKEGYLNRKENEVKSIEDKLKNILEEQERKKRIEEENQYNNFLKAVNNYDYKFVIDFINSAEFKNNRYFSNKRIKDYSKNTYGKDYLISNKKCLIFYLDCGASIVDMANNIYTSSNLNDNFLILDSFYYRSSSDNSKVTYMELD
ncbi:hypothetical protein [Brachyspira innocens]|uniref:hypothetical protein n=1 Tax=Brachyspira innocens TaxID=13264 RepID=UPI0003631B1B|nr:hypothetical protein [Brachyspira innocens]